MLCRRPPPPHEVRACSRKRYRGVPVAGTSSASSAHSRSCVSALGSEQEHALGSPARAGSLLAPCRSTRTASWILDSNRPGFEPLGAAVTRAFFDGESVFRTRAPKVLAVRLGRNTVLMGGRLLYPLRVCDERRSFHSIPRALCNQRLTLSMGLSRDHRDPSTTESSGAAGSPFRQR